MKVNIFDDASSQGVRYLKDFNIVEEAGGVGKGITREYDVDVDDGTLEIHLYWAGKGTTSIPDRGVYGPLISAIEMIPSEFFLFLLVIFLSSIMPCSVL